MNILGIVPARGGSRGIPGKNLALCAGKPLIEWTYDALRDSKLVDGWLVSTDSHDIADHFQGWAHGGRGNVSFAEPISDDAQIEDRLDAVIRMANPNIIVLLQPTSPVRTGKQIDEAIEQLQREGANSLVSAARSHSLLWYYGEYADPRKGEAFFFPGYASKSRPRRQELDNQYEENGSIYVFTREHWERTHNRLGGKISLYVMPEECRYQVDSPHDLWMVEKVLKRQHAAVS